MRRLKRSGTLTGIFCLLLLFCLIQARTANAAEERYPTRTIRFIVPMAAGGSTDINARRLAELSGKALGQEVIIDNRPGAGGAVGATYVARSKPDGYTIGGLASSTFCVSPFFTKMDFDPLTDLTPIFQMYNVNHWLYVSTDSPIKNFKDFLETARKRQVLVGCVGMLLGDMALQRIAEIEKVNIKLVPFGGGSQIVAPLLGGKVDAGVSSGTPVAYVRSGKMRIIARLTEGPPMKEMKDVPQPKDLGYDVNAAGFVGVFGPKGLPKAIQTKLEEVMGQFVHDPSIVESIESYGDVANFRNSRDFAAFLKVEYDRAGKMIKELGLGLFAKEKK